MTNDEAIRIIQSIQSIIISPNKEDRDAARAFQMGINALEKQDPKEPVHVHEKYPEHDWKRDEENEIDMFAFSDGFCNGPVCKRCNYSFCEHCESDGWNKKSCVIDEYHCPKCGSRIINGTKFCNFCGQALKWNE